MSFSKRSKINTKDVELKPLNDSYEERDPEVGKIITGAEALVDDSKRSGSITRRTSTALKEYSPKRVLWTRGLW